MTSIPQADPGPALFGVPSEGEPDAGTESVAGPPRPLRTRWQPLRSGLLNLYRFDHEEFVYEDGHLLLRGNNGTGKSRVLALQLPFLLDGDVSPYRLEPDGDPAKRIEWNLLMGKHSDRLGYTWVELGRRVETEDDENADGDGDGTEERFLTLGCGLKAVEGRGLVSKWFFVSEKRIGVDLSLQGSAGEALTRKRLEDALGDDGEIFTSATDYRRAIDQRLFGLGEARYEALVRLLIQLRQPQLARKLDEELLSQALSDALPPLSEAILADVAEAFASLDSERRAVADLRAARQGADAFLEVYARYARVLARRRAEAVRLRHSAYERCMKRLREAEATRDDTAKRVAALEERRKRLQAEHEGLDAEVRTLESSPEMRDKQSLDAARRRAEGARRELEAAARRLESAEEELEAGRRRLAAARATAESRRGDARRELDAARVAARDAVLHRRGAESWARLEEALEGPPGESAPARTEEDLAEEAERADATDATDADAVAATGRALEALRGELDRRREGIRHLRDLAHEIGRRESALGLAKEEHVRATAEVDESVDAHRRAQGARESAVEELLEAFGSWRRELEVLDVEPVGEDALREWARELVGPSPLVRIVEAAAERAREIVARHLAAVESQIAEERDELRELENRARELEEGVEIPPPAPHTRDEAARAARETVSAGAPLWKLCDFHDEVPAATRAAAEAALEAAGLLDAWVTPGGELLDAAEHETLLSVGDEEDAGEAGSTLDGILRPDLPEGMDGEMAATVVGILRRIGWVEGERSGEESGERGVGRVWVAASGRYRVGPLHGAWAKDGAQYLGASAREAERRRCLAATARKIEATESRLAALGGERRDAERQAEAIRREVASVPSDERVRDAASEVTAARREVKKARERQVAAETRVHERRAARDETEAERDRAALDLGLADHLHELEALGRAVDVYDRRLASFGPVLDLHRAAAADLVERRHEAGRRQAERERLAAEHGDAATRSHRAEAERRTLEENLGESVERLLEKLEAARADREARWEEIGAAREEETRLQVEKARAEERIAAEGESLAGHEADRDEAVGGLRDLAGLRLLAVAVPGLAAGDADAWSVTRAVEVARAVEAELHGEDAGREVWDRLQGRVHERFRDLTDTLLPHGYEPSLATPADTLVVQVPFQGRSMDVGEFRAALGEETATRERVLAAREREILENHLLSEVSLHLHDRLRAAEELVREINAEIESRPMSTGMRLRFDWRPRHEEVEHLKEARRLLLTDHRMRSAAENQAVGHFLQNLIEEQRESEEGGTWSDHLSRALDYRAWHRFAIEQHQGGQWRRLTRRTHGTGSGGEKAIALTVPQFAAAAAHYRSARDEAPRLILLDEAFVGVDADMRAKCMGLLAAFDLDFVMTSEREWGCYPTLPGLAIYQLATHPGIDAVGVTRWVWNGRERLREP